MKYILSIALSILLPLWMTGQQGYPDSLRQALKMATTDSAKYATIVNLVIYYVEDNMDSCLNYQKQGLLIARKNDHKIDEAEMLTGIACQFAKLGKYAESFEYFEEAFKNAKDPGNEKKAWLNNAWRFTKKYSYHQNRLAALEGTYMNAGIFRGFSDDTDQQLFHFKRALQLAEEIGDSLLAGFASLGIGGIYLSVNKLDSALALYKKGGQILTDFSEKKHLGGVYLAEGRIYSSKGDMKKALYYYHKSLAALAGQNNTTALSGTYWSLSNYYLQEKQRDSCLYYAKKSVELQNSIGSKRIGRAYLTLSKSYELRNETDSAYKYQGLALTVIDSNFQAEIKNQSEFQKQSFKDQMRVKELEQEKASYQNKIRTNFLLGGLFALLAVAFILFRNNRQKQKANSLIAKQKEQVENTLQELKSTQSQLIQSEKMASLGELTAGIAHEIQNPLNFVNNFSEINKELLLEMNDEIEKGNLGEARSIAKDVIDNEEKINHHGKRADGIVKGMLQHSRSGSGVKGPTDINALADEYLRLSYHGLRAKDNSFNAIMRTDFDVNLSAGEAGTGCINIISQDIGRVLLNLYNNAFYAVSEKKKQQTENYSPTVSVSTKKVGDKAEIKVSDNGNGILQKIVDKIFQPFFTTKPTGQGTGLGLSLSYDIVKAHGGEIKVNTKEGEFTEFVIKLPISV